MQDINTVTIGNHVFDATGKIRKLSESDNNLIQSGAYAPILLTISILERAGCSFADDDSGMLLAKIDTCTFSCRQDGIYPCSIMPQGLVVSNLKITYLHQLENYYLLQSGKVLDIAFHKLFV